MSISMYKIKKFYRRIFWVPRYIKKSIKNLIVWFPVIWKDRQWDQSYLYLIMIKKLELMEKFFNSDDCHIADWKLVRDEIRYAKEALIRLEKDNYILS